MLPCPGHTIPITPVLVMIGDVLTSFLQTHVVMNQIPTGSQLCHVREIEKIPQRQSNNHTRGPGVLQIFSTCAVKP